MELVTRFRIVGVEVVGVGAFSLLLGFLEQRELRASAVVDGFTWVWAIVGVTLILVGLETVALSRNVPAPEVR